MRPRVTIHNAININDHLLEWDMVDMALYYGLIGTFEEQATLVGAETLLAGAAHEQVPADADDAHPLEAEPGDGRPLLVVPDSRGRVRMWNWMLSQPYWKRGVALCSSDTPMQHLSYLERIGVDRVVCGTGQVDLASALTELRERYGVERVRVDSGGALNGVLLRLGLVNEVSLLVAPVLMGDDSSRPFYRAPSAAGANEHVGLRLTYEERLDGDNLWLRYEVVR